MSLWGGGDLIVQASGAGLNQHLSKGVKRGVGENRNNRRP